MRQVGSRGERPCASADPRRDVAPVASEDDRSSLRPLLELTAAQWAAEVGRYHGALALTQAARNTPRHGENSP